MTNGRDVQVEKMDTAVMDVRTDKDQMKMELKPQKAETMKSHPYLKVALAGIVCLSLCASVGFLAASPASKETCVTGVALLEEGQEVQLKTTERRRLDADNLLRGTHVQECLFTKDGVMECTDGEVIWELADPDTTDIPNNFLKGKGKLKGTLKLGAAVKTIGKNAFLKTKLTGLDLSEAATLKSIGAKAFRNTRITATIETPFNAPTYKANSFPKGISIVSTISPSPSPPPPVPSSPPPAPEEFLLAEEELFERFDVLSPETKESLTSCVKELLAMKNPEHKEWRKWWRKWQKINVDSKDLHAFFEQWMRYAIVPNGTFAPPTVEHPAGVPDSSGYFIERWDILANTKLGLSLNGFDKEWRAWFVDFLNVRGQFIKTTASWEGNGKLWEAYSEPATGKSGEHPFNLSTYLVPPGGFKTFNGFFLRWVKDFANNRPLPADMDDAFSIVSPCDGGQFSLSNQSTTAETRHPLPGKYDSFNVVEAFPGYGEKFVGGPLLDNFLWFSDFHHFFAPVSGTLVSMHVYPGSYNYDFDDFDPYNPTYKAKGTSDQAGWYQQLAKHKRFVWIFKTEKLGLVAMAAIGFLGVGSIVVDDRLYPQTWAGGPIARDDPSPGVSPGKGGDLTPAVKIGDTVTKGSYLGHFGYGGSSIVLAFQPEVNGKSLSYNFAASPTGAPSGSAPLPIENYDGPIQVKALQQIGVAKLE